MFPKRRSIRFDLPGDREMLASVPGDAAEVICGAAGTRQRHVLYQIPDGIQAENEFVMNLFIVLIVVYEDRDNDDGVQCIQKREGKTVPARNL